MNSTLEDRLRAYYRARSEQEPLPPADAGTGPGSRRVQALLSDSAAAAGGEEGVVRSTGARPTGWSPRPLRLVAAAAVVVALVGVGITVLADDANDDPRMGPGPDQDDDPITTTSTGPETSDTTDPTTSDPTTSTTAAPVAGGRTSVVGAFGELGGWDGSRWVDADDGGWDPAVPGVPYQVVTLDGVTEATSAAGAGCSPGRPDIVEVGIDWDGLIGPGIGVAGVADPRPRAATALDTASPTYRDAAWAMLGGLEVDTERPEVRQVLQVDFDGDGTDEVVVAAGGVSPAGPRTGDASIVFVRRVVDGEVVPQVIDFWSFGGEQVDVRELAVGAIADLDGDGRMELVVNTNVWEGAAQTVYEMGPDGTFREVLINGCGH